MTKTAGTSPGELAGIGFQFVVAILLFLWVGDWLDHRFGTHWLAVVGVFTGAGLGFYSMYRKLMAAQAADDAARKAKRDGTS